eukprot:TRINITY_DN7499_c0_g1_i7.p1 TRINITY_DN7499_c0_g1~~TRINITY_DN7499_c0_g1_i7.p1  ORF type:complete len:596 (-),score=128.03 TRINITY_DN7499_c0_g1_i7:229-2016(-)
MLLANMCGSSGINAEYGAGEILSETEVILETHSVDTSDFHPKIISGIPDKLVLSDEEVARRRDFRNTRIFTIDPLTARDLDDALHVTPLPNGNFSVGVHIADVSHYIRPDTDLDTVARSRATSVYLVHRVIPMLPPLLCDNLCSLNPGVDRLAFSIVWEMNQEGDILDQWLGRSLIRSAGKLAYEHAQKVIENYDAGVEEISRLNTAGHDPKDIAKDILLLNSIAVNLRSKRYKNGALSLGRQKMYFNVDEDYNPTGFYVYVQKEANQLIEEFMLLANMCVAKFIYQHFPENSLLRHHPPPSERKMLQFERFCQLASISVDTSNSFNFHNDLCMIPERYPDIQGLKQIVEELATRPMNRALYFCTGDVLDEEHFHHYALNVPFYTHFTSPIRRYADVCVHRLLNAAITCSGQGIWSQSAISTISKHCNTKKLNARRAQTSADTLYLAIYLRTNPVTDDGCIVYELKKTFLECFSPLLGLCMKVFLDGYEVEVKGTQAILTKKKMTPEGEDLDSECKKQPEQSLSQLHHEQPTSQPNQQVPNSQQLASNSNSPTLSNQVVLKILSIVKVHFTMRERPAIDIRGTLIPDFLSSTQEI